MKKVTPEDYSNNFSIEERTLLAETMNNLDAVFENVVLIVAHPTLAEGSTAPVTASFRGSDKFLSNVSKKMYEQFYKKERQNEKD